MEKKLTLDFFIIGAQKSASTWLYRCLKEHPEIFLPEKKLDKNYIGSEWFNKEGVDWFEEQYKNVDSKSLIGEVSVDYIYDSNTPKNISPFVDQPKFLAILRDPVDRMISSYFWAMRKGRIPDLPIEEGIEPLLQQPVGFPNSMDGWYEEVVRRGNYGKQIKNLLQHFDKDSLYIILYKDIKNDSAKVIQNAYNFLGVDSKFSPSSLESRPLQNTYNNFLIKFERLGSRKSILGKMIFKTAVLINEGMAKSKKPDYILSKEIDAELRSRFLPFIEETKEVLSTLPEKNRPSDNQLNLLWNKR